MAEDARDGDVPASIERIRAEMVERLRSGSAEIEQAIYARVQDAVPDPVASKDPAYQAGVRGAIAAVVAYGLESIERGPEWSGPVPSAAAAQARLAARTGVSLGAVLRRYVAGHGELGDFVMKEALRCRLANNGPALHQIRRTQEAVLEHLTAAIEREYNDERERVARSAEQRRMEIVQKLLSREPVDPAELAELDYDIHASWHLGLIVAGLGADEFCRSLKARHGRGLMVVSLDGSVWAWLGAPTKPVAAYSERLPTDRHADLSLAVGEPGRGVDGWRLTHRQAHEALRIAMRRPERFACYADYRLLAATLQNETLVESLRQKYLIPLGSQRDGGAALRRTLRTYIALECNATSAEHELKVGRRSVKERVRAAERLVGCSLGECLAELDVALRLEELDHASIDKIPPAAG